MKIKNKILLYSSAISLFAMLLIFLVFYFLVFQEIKRELVSIYKSKSISLFKKFENSIEYNRYLAKKYSLSKEFKFLFDDNFIIRKLSIFPSKQLIKKIIKDGEAIDGVFIFDNKQHEIFNLKPNIDIDKLIKNKMVFKNRHLYIYEYLDSKKDFIVFRLNLQKIGKNISDKEYPSYFLISKTGKILLSSPDFKTDKNITFLKQTRFFQTKSSYYYIKAQKEYDIGTKVDKNILFKKIDTLFWIVLASILIIFILSLMQALKISSIVTDSIYKLIRVLSQNKKGEYKKIDIKGDDEVEYFAQKYNEMIDRISNFTDKLKKEVEKRTKKIQSQKEELQRLYQLDTLTGLYNRNKLNEIVIQRENDTKDRKTTYSIIMIDIDDFKKINDTYGHKIGDDILKDFTKILKENTRKSDFLGRWGGEEFIIICSNQDKKQALNLAEKIRKKIENHNFSKNLKVTASFGIAEYKNDISYDELFILADKALYKAKTNGKNRVEYLQ